MMVSTYDLIACYCERERQLLSLPQPSYSSNQSTLLIGEVVAKKFRHAAPNQELILIGFQEAGWPFRIDDPLPTVHGKCPRERIANAVKRLNRSQQGEHRIRFCLRNNGESVCWKIKRVS